MAPSPVRGPIPMGPKHLTTAPHKSLSTDPGAPSMPRIPLGLRSRIPRLMQFPLAPDVHWTPTRPMRANHMKGTRFGDTLSHPLIGGQRFRNGTGHRAPIRIANGFSDGQSWQFYGSDHGLTKPGTKTAQPRAVFWTAEKYLSTASLSDSPNLARYGLVFSSRSS